MALPGWMIAVLPILATVFLILLFALCYYLRLPCKQPTRTQPAMQDGPIHEPGYYNESFRQNEPAVFTIPGAAFMPYTTGFQVNYVMSSTSVIAITSETDDEDDDAQLEAAAGRETAARTVENDGWQCDDGITLSVNTLPAGPPRYGSLYFCPPPDYEEALEIQEVDDSLTTHL